MAQLWTIASTVDGSVLHAAFFTDSPGQHPKDKGWPWDATKQKATRIDAQPDTALQSWNGTAWVDDLAKFKAAAIARLKDEAEQLKMNSLTPGGAKKAEYAAKESEVKDSDQLGGALLTTLSALKLTGSNALDRRFPQASADAAAFGDTIPDALNRFRAGIAKSAPCPKIAGVESKVCFDVRAAATIAALTTVLARHKWPTA